MHYTAGNSDTTVYQTAAYQVGPTSHLPFPAIAYHYYVELNGTTYWCHNHNIRTWGSDGVGINERAVHICYAGNLAPTSEQLSGMRAARLHAQTLLQRELEVRGHKDNSFTACPGPQWPNWKDEV